MPKEAPAGVKTPLSPSRFPKEIAHPRPTEAPKLGYREAVSDPLFAGANTKDRRGACFVDEERGFRTVNFYPHFPATPIELTAIPHGQRPESSPSRNAWLGQNGSFTLRNSIFAR